MQEESNYLTYEYNRVFICQLKDNGYICLNALSRAANKQLSCFMNLKTTKEFLEFFKLYSDIAHKNPLPPLIEHDYGTIFAHPVVAIFFAQWCHIRLAFAVTNIVKQWMESNKPESFDFGEINTLTRSLQKAEAKVQELETVINQIQKVVTPRKDHEDIKWNKRAEIERLISEYALSNNITNDWAWEMLYADFCSYNKRNIGNIVFQAFDSGLDYLEQQPKLMEQFCDFMKLSLPEKDLSS